MPHYRILFFAAYRGGGVENFSRMLLSHLSHDFYVDLLTIGNGLEWKRNFITKIADLISTTWKLAVKLKIGNYDVVHINPSFKIYPLLRESVYQWIINRAGYGNQTVVFFHGWDRSLAQKVIHNSFYRKLFGKIYRKVNLVFVLYDYCKEQLVNMGIEPQKIKVTTTMYKRIDVLEEDSDVEAAQFKAGDQISDKDVNILFMSVFLKGKGMFIAAGVAKCLVENGYQNFRLILAGDGPLLAGIRTFIVQHGISQYVSTPGYVQGSEKDTLLRNGDIFLFPTQLQEGCPIVIMEAMGAGLAIVSTPCGAIPSLVKQGENGFIRDSHAPDEFYGAVRKLLDDRELLNRMKRTNRAKAEESYEVEKYTRKMEGVYRAVGDAAKLSV